MDEKDFRRFFKFRKDVFRLIEKVDEGYHKSYEGAVDLKFCYQNIYEAKNVEDIDCVEIELHCYLLVNGRHIAWEGKTLSEALDKAEAWLKHVTEIESADD